MNVPIWPNGNINSVPAQDMLLAKHTEDESYWPTLRRVFAHDFQTLPRERFKVWASVWNVPFVHSHIPQEYVWAYLEALHTSKDTELYRQAAQEPMVGCTPADFRDYLSLFADSQESATRVQHLGHLILCGFTPKKLTSMRTIVELGSGIGEMPDIIRRLGFTGDYHIFDFPEVSNIQRWYHQQLGHTRTFYTDNPATLPHADLCIATWSLTEMPFALRDALMMHLGKSKNWLLAYSNEIFGMDNAAWVERSFLPRVATTKNRVEFRDIPSMPWNGGTRYVSVHRKGR